MSCLLCPEQNRTTARSWIICTRELISWFQMRNLKRIVWYPANALESNRKVTRYTRHLNARSRVKVSRGRCVRYLEDRQFSSISYWIMGQHHFILRKEDVGNGWKMIKNGKIRDVWWSIVVHNLRKRNAFQRKGDVMSSLVVALQGRYTFVLSRFLLFLFPSPPPFFSFPGSVYARVSLENW